MDSASYLLVFWTAADGDLLYARKRVAFGEWSGATQLATAPQAWRAFTDTRKRLYLAVIRAI